LPPARRYKRFSIPKKRGGNRIILEPTPNLKIIQQKLLQVLYAVYEPKSSVHGFISEKSIVTNAEQHVRKRYVLNVDLQNFFPSIHFGRVRGMFMAYPYNLNDAVATVLAQICSLPNCLPQGAPTSPIISNMICAKMDSQLQKLAKEHRCYYTRYADDLTFSTYVSRFPKSLAIVVRDEAGQHIEVGAELAEIIHQNGFKINKSKVRLQTKEQRQEVTGLTTNLFVNVNRKFIRQIRAMLHAWEKFGYQAAEDEYRVKYSYRNVDKPYKTLPSFQQVVKGKIEFVGMVRGRTDHIFIEFNNKAAYLERESSLRSQLFDFLRSADADDEILSLIAGGEIPEVEFKVGACLDPHINKKNNRMREKVVEEVAAFMNSHPRGTLLIGVADDGRIWGVEREYLCANPQKGNWDGYELFLTDVLNHSLSVANPYRFYTISQHVIQGKTVCAIRTTKSDEPVLSFKEDKLFIRSGTQCKELRGSEKVQYMTRSQE
jgi:RNA-directed DNA polymerase